MSNQRKASLSSLDPLFRALYALTIKQSSRSKGESRIKAGHTFEDATAKSVYSYSRECGLEAFPPRHTMNVPTLSGNSYQFDASFSHEQTVYVVECKRRQLTAAEHVPYFVSKVLDHSIAIQGKGSRVRGIFLSSVEVGQSSMQFGFAFGLKIISPEYLPLEELFFRSHGNEPLSRAIRKLWEQLDSADPLNPKVSSAPQTLLKSYEFLKRRVSNL
jgi:hypothetical protein